MIISNPANQCATCLAQQLDLTSILQGKDGAISILQCRQCRRYSRTETVWEDCEPESPQLLSICLKHIPALTKNHHHHYHNNSNNTNGKYMTKLQLKDAIWVWTEPHSMRLKVRLTIRAEVEQVPIQQRVMVEFIVRFRQCPSCNREYSNRTWHALVQLRQRRSFQGGTRKGLAVLEMALRRNQDIRKHVLKIDGCRNGLDFYFLTLPHAQQFARFLSRLAPMRIKTTQKMVSEDVKNNTANMKYTLACEMVPFCRDDLILIHKHHSGMCSGRLGLVEKVSSLIHIIDASPSRKTLDKLELHPDQYYKMGGEKIYPILQTSERMIRFVVLNVELCQPHSTTATATALITSNPSGDVEKYSLADVEVARESDFGVNDTTYNCVTHLGRWIQPGDVVLGYDLVSTSTTLSTSSSLGVVDIEDVVHSQFIMPDVVLVKKLRMTAPSIDMTTANDATTANATANATVETATNNTTTPKDTKNNLVAPMIVEDTDHYEEEDDQNRDEDEPQFQGGGGKKRISKKKQRRRHKQDKRARELEETAVRMGFIQDNGHQDHPPRTGDDDDYYDDEQDEGGQQQQPIDFDEQLANDPELAAELEDVEREMANMTVNDNSNNNNNMTPSTMESELPAETEVEYDEEDHDQILGDGEFQNVTEPSNDK